jgi:hypothetical protein
MLDRIDKAVDVEHAGFHVDAGAHAGGQMDLFFCQS